MPGKSVVQSELLERIASSLSVTRYARWRTPVGRSRLQILNSSASLNFLLHSCWRALLASPNLSIPPLSPSPNLSHPLPVIQRL
jgi:hypothetical protein